MRVHLERVHLDTADVVQVREDVDVRIALGVADGLVVVVPALGVVVRHRANERELHLGEALLHLTVGVDHAQRVLPGIEARDLRQQRPLDVDSELVDDVGRILGRKGHVLRRQRIDRGRPDVRRRQARRPRDVLVHVEDRRVVAAECRQQEVEHTLIGCREIDVAAPDPARRRRGEALDHESRLRIVDDHEVVLVLELLRVLLVVAAVDLLLVGRQPLWGALESVVDRLRRREELIGAADDPPFGVETGVAHQGHQRVEDLRDSAAEGSR